MKTMKLAALALGVTLATPAFSQFYAGGSAGRSTLDPKRTDWETAGAVTTFDDKDSAWKLYAGYGFSKHFGVELQYADLGEYRANISDPVTPETGNVNVKVRSWGAYLTGKLPVAGNFSLSGKIGYARNRARMSFSSTGARFFASDSGSKSTNELAYGIGLGYAFTKNVALRAEWEQFGKAGNTNNNFTTPGNTSESKPDLLSVGVQFTF
jgi:OOP family OmpA-OmpF porin